MTRRCPRCLGQRKITLTYVSGEFQDEPVTRRCYVCRGKGTHEGRRVYRRRRRSKAMRRAKR